jgi:hypothetical protein
MKNNNQQDRNDPHKITKLVEEEWDQTNTRLAKYDQNRERTPGWKSELDIVWWSYPLSDRTEHCPTGGFWNLKTKDRTLSGSYRTLSSRRSLENVIFSQNLPLSSQPWFLSYRAPNRIKLRHKSHLNTRNKFPNEVFFQIQGFPFWFWMNSKT